MVNEGYLFSERGTQGVVEAPDAYLTANNVKHKFIRFVSGEPGTTRPNNIGLWVNAGAPNSSEAQERRALSTTASIIGAAMSAVYTDTKTADARLVMAVSFFSLFCLNRDPNRADLTALWDLMNGRTPEHLYFKLNPKGGA